LVFGRFTPDGNRGSVKASVAIDGSKFKAVNNRDRNFTRAKVERRRAQLEESVARYLSQLDTADRQSFLTSVACSLMEVISAICFGLPRRTSIAF
jgi:hypothetical protein